MKIRILILLLAVFMFTECRNTTKDNTVDNAGQSNEETVRIKKYYSEGKLIKEVTFRDDIKHGICRNYYDDGRLKRTIWYENGLKEDTAKWYYPEGKVYRATPYKKDKIHGVQTKYYKTGRIQATIPYRDGLRLEGLKEYLPDGRDAEKYPDIEYTVRDLTKTDAGILRLMTQLSNESVNVKFYRGSLVEGAFDPDKCRDITASSGMGFLELRTDSQNGKDYVDIIALYTTRFRNTKIITKRIKLPYSNYN